MGIINRFFKNLYLNDIILEINSIGSITTRKKYKEVLIEYLNKYKNSFNSETIYQLKTNPLRILDSKDKEIIKILKTAPILSKFFNKKEECLQENYIPYKKNPYLVRGLDYYNDFV